MFAFKPRTEIMIRVFLTAVILFNALVPTAALAAPSEKPGTGTDNETSQDLPPSLPEPKPVFYDPPQIIYPQQTSPEGDKPKSPVPPKDDVEFTLTSDPAIIPANGLVKFNVYIGNHYPTSTVPSLISFDSTPS